jgi:kynurenine formamidase
MATSPRRRVTRRDGYTVADFERFVAAENNWGRWGEDDQLGTVNLITTAKRREAAACIRTGEVVSLSRPISTVAGPSNPVPAQRHVWCEPRGSFDYLGLDYHGFAVTHLDALCHSWDASGMYNGVDPALVFEGRAGATRLDVSQWGDGLVTRGVLIDVPAHRARPYVDRDNPVHGWELEEICATQGIEVTPGDAVVVYSGRDAYDAAHDVSWGPSDYPKPGLHASCLEFFRATDTAVLVWDMLDQGPYDNSFHVHAGIFVLGLALVDNAVLEQLARLCRAQQRYTFQLVLAPLMVLGGTGSPVNPLALF